MSLNTTFGTITAIIRSFARMNGSAILSLFHRPTRTRFLEASREYYRVYLRPPRIAEVSPADIIDDSATIHLSRCVRSRWQVTLVELAVLVGITRARQAKNIFEIGTFDGRTTLAMHLNAPDAVIHTIDLPAGKPDSPGGNQPGRLIRELVERSAIKQLFGDTTQFDFFPWFGTQDLVFVDAGHSYRNALADSRTALRLVEGREGAIIWHDYAVMPGVTRAVEEIEQQVASDVDFRWIEGTSLAVMLARPGHPIALSANRGVAHTTAQQSLVAVDAP